MFNISDSILKQAQHPLVNYFLSIPKDLKYEISGEEPTLHLVEIYFDTATFDDIEQDKKVKFEAQLSLVGGTMGLLTGFGIETIYFLIFSVFQTFDDFPYSGCSTLSTSLGLTAPQRRFKRGILRLKLALST